MAAIDDIDQGQQRSHSDPQQDVERLRQLLLGDEYEAALRQYVDKGDAERVAQVISEAIRERSRQDDSLGKALAPVIDAAIESSVQANPERITRVIFPIMGPAIRKAVAAAIAGMVQSLNQVLEHSLSLKALSWRFSAWRAGKSYAEYVLLQSLQFRVEQVLFIHRETGLLLASAIAPSVKAQDPEMVSAMLTAISDFVSDSFAKTEQQSLEFVRMGDLILQVEVGPDAVLAAAVRGTPSTEVSTHITETLELLHQRFHGALETFSGDRSAFADSLPYLEDCLIQRHRQPQRSRRPWLALVVLAAVAGYLLWQGYREYQWHGASQDLLQALAAQPGYQVINATRQGPHLQIQLLRSPLVPAPDGLLAAAEKRGLQPQLATQLAALGDLTFYLPLLRERWQLPAHTHLSVRQKQLVVSGPLAAETLQQIKTDPAVTQLFSGIDSQQTQIIPPPSQQQLALQRFKTLAQQVQALPLTFEIATTHLTADSNQVFAALIPALQEMEKLAPQAGLQLFQILVQGFADETGAEAKNRSLSRQRAELIRSILADNGVTTDLLVAWGAGHIDRDGVPPDLQRRVTLQVLYKDNDSAGGTAQ